MCLFVYYVERPAKLASTTFNILRKKSWKNIEAKFKPFKTLLTSFWLCFNMFEGGSKRFQHCFSIKSNRCWSKCWNHLHRAIQSVTWGIFPYNCKLIDAVRLLSKLQDQHNIVLLFCWCNCKRPPIDNLSAVSKKVVKTC